jgi:hypothetical protein
MAGDDAMAATHDVSEATPEEEVRTLIRLLVATGYDARDVILQDITDYCEGYTEDEKPSDHFILSCLDQAIEAQLEDQMAWSARTDCDRLDDAFHDMNEQGILALQHFACCQTCGFAEMEDEIAYAKEQGHAVRGFVFFPRQDSEAAARGEGLHLSYAALSTGDHAQITKDTLAMMDDVAATLGRHGLKTEWNRTLNQRMRIILDWKRRFPVVLQ